MLASNWDGNIPDDDYYIEPKIDGMRVMVSVDLQYNAVFFTTRNGKPILCMDHLTNVFFELARHYQEITGDKLLPGCPIHFDGEISCTGRFFDDIGRMRSAQPCRELIIHLFDLPNLSDQPYITRRNVLEAIFKMTNMRYWKSVRIIDVSEVNADIQDAMEHAQADDNEGIMIKMASGLYETGQRSKMWMKHKTSFTYDCPITAMGEGQGRLAGTCGFLVVRHGNAHIHVGSGLSDDLRKAIWNDSAKFLGLIAEVKCQVITPNGSMRHPVLVRIRDDK